MSGSDVDAVLVVILAVLCAAAGYVVGSLPVSAWVARSAGPGWGLLAVTADLATGVLPVALATVTWSWGTGWAAGIGAVTGACWPAFGRRPGGHGVVVLAGAAFALAPPAGILSLLPALAVLGVARLLGRNGLAAATAVGFGTYPFLFLAAYRDPLRLAALMGLYLVVGLRYVATRRGRSGKADPAG